MRAPVDVERLCLQLELSIIRTDFVENEAQIGGAEISGMLYVYENGKGTIYVREHDPDVRQRFTIAHELGHYFLHYTAGESTTFVSLRRSRSARETEANAFAAELLMPEALIYGENDLHFFPSISHLSTRLKVSKEAMRYRLDGLGLYYVE